jgi:hypothetical protein
MKNVWIAASLLACASTLTLFLLLLRQHHARVEKRRPQMENASIPVFRRLCACGQSYFHSRAFPKRLSRSLHRKIGSILGLTSTTVTN